MKATVKVAGSMALALCLLVLYALYAPYAFTQGLAAEDTAVDHGNETCYDGGELPEETPFADTVYSEEELEECLYSHASSGGTETLGQNITVTGVIEANLGVDRTGADRDGSDGKNNQESCKTPGDNGQESGKTPDNDIRDSAARQGTDGLPATEDIVASGATIVTVQTDDFGVLAAADAQDYPAPLPDVTGGATAETSVMENSALSAGAQAERTPAAITTAGADLKQEETTPIPIPAAQESAAAPPLSPLPPEPFNISEAMLVAALIAALLGGILLWRRICRSRR